MSQVDEWHCKRQEMAEAEEIPVLVSPLRALGRVDYTKVVYSFMRRGACTPCRSSHPTGKAGQASQLHLAGARLWTCSILARRASGRCRRQRPRRCSRSASSAPISAARPGNWRRPRRSSTQQMWRTGRKRGTASSVSAPHPAAVWSARRVKSPGARTACTRW